MLNRVLKTSPVFVLIFGAVMISFSSVFVKASHVPPSVSAFYRVFFGGLCLLPVCLIKKDFKNIGLNNHMVAVICGLLFSLDLWAWHKSIQSVGPGIATILANFQVFILSGVGVLAYKEKLSVGFAFSVAMAFSGLFLLIGIDIGQLSTNYYIGILLGLAAAFFYSLFLLLLRRLQSEDDAPIFYYQMILSFTSALFLGAEGWLVGHSFSIPDQHSLVCLVSLGVFNQALAWVLITNALPLVKASYAGLILLLQPSLSFLWDVLIFKRETGWIGWAGFFIVIIAIFFGMRHKADT